MKSFLCVLPWNHLFMANDGRRHPCCLSQNEGSVLDPGPQNTESSALIDLRLKMRQGIIPKACEYCAKIESTGQSSYRNYVNGLFTTTLKRLVDNPDINVSLGYEFIDIRFGNKCNLKCRMCGPKSSAGLIQEFNQYYQKDHTVKYKADKLGLREAEIEKVTRVNIAGGEPFLMEEVYVFVKQLSELKNAKNLTLTYNSNLTVLDQRQIDLWPLFKKVDVAVSVDGFQDLNNYIRYPSNWGRILSHIENIRPLAGVYINCTVQIYNILYLEQMIDFFEKDLGIHINLNILDAPHHLNIQAMPESLKSLAISNLEKIKHRYPARPDILPLIKYMQDRDLSAKFAEFKKWTQFLDKSRQQSLSDVAPALANS